MNNKIEYQICFEITENLKDVSNTIAEYSRAVEYAASVSKNFENAVSFNNVANEAISLTAAILDIFNNVKN